MYQHEKTDRAMKYVRGFIISFDANTWCDTKPY